jgi:hypothetical protein
MTEYNASTCLQCGGKSQVQYVRHGQRGTIRVRSCVGCHAEFVTREQRLGGPESTENGISVSELIRVHEMLGIGIDTDEYIREIRRNNFIERN